MIRISTATEISRCGLRLTERDSKKKKGKAKCSTTIEITIAPQPPCVRGRYHLISSGRDQVVPAADAGRLGRNGDFDCGAAFCLSLFLFAVTLGQAQPAPADFRCGADSDHARDRSDLADRAGL